MKSMLALSMFFAVMVLSGCSNLTVLDPKGPVAEQQANLILFSIGFMLFIVVVVFVLFTLILVKYRERKSGPEYEPPHIEGNVFLEIVWTVIPIIILVVLAIPTVQTIFALEEAPEATSHKDPIVIHATSVDWKWVFSYPEENIETVNYLHIPEDHPILFKLASADSMGSFWIPSLGGQEYTMSGMMNELYLQADVPGEYRGRNANFTGEGFTEQTFTVTAESEEDYEEWVAEAQDAPELTQEKYNELMLKGHVEEMTFSETHLQWVDHGMDAEYATKVRNGELNEEENLKQDDDSHDSHSDMNHDDKKDSEEHSH
ncbi:cytochrome aa3 quinol oxidase subunit II [Pseudalkalibacillus hwajinpoensis]|uniref:Quinol oxidase subunit 2 n=1 Tax=Guptibacillus hwajinpoensis TaxID=208199 RepID=A0A4U1MJR5_9BACL|nr:cytochrome aa3 quinol oxidase subunit II [Pseudalkalibacillus hwajinpoensis]TKD71067.1 cytochrome aa3 quinol oxidase subunit II [Pseudalkalibacillus hwajinpoensis]